MSMLVCLPTDNEVQNVEAMLRAVRRALPRAELLVLDDDSPDGTGEVAERVGAELGGVAVLHRPRKEGLGPAYLDGFRYALRAGADHVLTMDCDFSHAPEDLPRLVDAAGSADLVVGSRYVAGGSVRDWGMFRRLVSTVGVTYARIALGVEIRDLTSGLKCYRRPVLEALPLDAIASRGYAFQVETTYRALCAGFRVVEIPIAFADRAAGGSKMSRTIVWEAVWRVPALRAAALAGRL